MSTHRLTVFSLLLVFTLLVAACGESSAPAATAAEVAATEAPVAAVAATEAPNTQDPATEALVEETVVADSPAVTDTAATTETAESAPAAASVESVTRTFLVTPANGSTAQYAVEEEFFGQAIPFVTAVGVTDQIDGSLVLEVASDGISLVDGGFTVDLTTLTSDQGRRDNAIRRDWLQSNTYPNAIFSNIEVVNLPADVTEDQDVTFQLTGDLTVREIAQPVTWDVTARVENGALTGTAVTNILMADYGFDAPNIAGMLKVTDGVTVTVNLVATEQ